MIPARLPVVMLGRLPRSVQRACHVSAKAAGVVPAVFYRTHGKSALVLGEDASRPLFVRWRGRLPTAVEWSFDPGMFSPRHKRAAMRAMVDVIADAKVTTLSLEERRKKTLTVS